MLKVNSEEIHAFAASHKYLPWCNIKVTKSHRAVDLDTMRNPWYSSILR